MNKYGYTELSFRKKKKMNVEGFIKKLQEYPKEMVIPSIKFNTPTDLFYFLDNLLLAKAATEKLPSYLRRWYIPNFGTGDGNEFGEFLGLSCKFCNIWIEDGHEEDCPVATLNEEKIDNFTATGEDYNDV